MSLAAISGLSPARILAVDDTPLNLSAIEAMLQSLGVEIVTARSGPEALQRLESEEFAVILLDIQMPGMDGFETLEHIRHEGATDTPVIFLTAYSHNTEMVHRAYSLGAFDFVTKPFDSLVLRSKVRSFVEFYERGRQLRLKQVALETKDKYLGILAHDLRTPLSVVCMGAKFLAETAHVSETKVMAERIGRSAQRMEQLVRDLLEHAQTAAHKLPIHKAPMDLAELCHDLIADYRAVHPEVDFAAEIDSELIGTWDRARLHQALANLLTNAVKYGDGSVQLRVARGPGCVQVEVINSGEPIAADRIDSIFEPFVQGERANSGLGLGLSIVREIVENHGGVVAVSSSARCTCFRVTLPQQGEAPS